jgi:hypothetical protein
MLGFADTTAMEMLDHLFLTCGNITTVDLKKIEQIRKTWDLQHPVDTTLFKQIQYCSDFSEAGGLVIGDLQQIDVGYAKIFDTCTFTSAFRRWNKKETADITWSNFRAHFAAAHRQ